MSSLTLLKNEKEIRFILFSFSNTIYERVVVSMYGGSLTSSCRTSGADLNKSMRIFYSIYITLVCIKSTLHVILLNCL